MLFDSFHFLVFFPIVVLLHYWLPHRYRWALLLGASYYFYMCWKPAYVVLILFSTLVDYVAALAIGAASTRLKRSIFLTLSLTANLGLLFTFKYIQFFLDSVALVYPALRSSDALAEFDFLLPVGISFYTFQSLSYTLDVFRGKREPERHFGYLALYVAFFPQLVAGPIERSTRLLPQLMAEHKFNVERTLSGCHLMLWGFFKKLVVADRLGIYVDTVYSDLPGHYGAQILCATYFFAYQIYCDFSAYSDIAIGASMILGVRLMENFRAPYRAASIPEFWRRWHISLSTWFRDYLYFPLGGNRVSRMRWLRNIAVVFLLSGLWHGANWTFVAWGCLHGVYLIVSRLTHGVRHRVATAVGLTRTPKVHALVQKVVTFHLVLLGWVFFRAESLSDTHLVFRNGFTDLTKSLDHLALDLGYAEFLFALACIIFVEFVQTMQGSKTFVEFESILPRGWRWALSYVLLFGILMFAVSGGGEFIYFQF